VSPRVFNCTIKQHSGAVALFSQSVLHLLTGPSAWLIPTHIPLIRQGSPQVSDANGLITNQTTVASRESIEIASHLHSHHLPLINLLHMAKAMDSFWYSSSPIPRSHWRIQWLPGLTKNPPMAYVRNAESHICHLLDFMASLLGL
jgi:hypothetical protein